MNRIDKKFKELKKKKQKAFIAYITALDPSSKITKELVLKFDAIGVDIVEFGIPFSDPIADGPTIQRASHRSLVRNKTNLKRVFTLVKTLRKNTQIPIVFMTYFNPIFRYGIDKFINDAYRFGVDGVIVPDLPPEEAKELVKNAKSKKIKTIFLAAPTSTSTRLRLIKKACTGFLYYVSLTGVTGARKKLPSQIKADVEKIKRLIGDFPVCVGFGISNPQQAGAIAKFSDGIIIGSAIVSQIEKNLGKRDLARRVTAFTEGLVKAVKN